ncbi:hypothetical protein V1512DRAFT_265394 [Lipomyces arxii]|uniref:uncharacterized protein n=1 Tax=Lipomyces arxii TaxID=56418 RepID=UPI0034CD526F
MDLDKPTVGIVDSYADDADNENLSVETQSTPSPAPDQTEMSQTTLTEAATEITELAVISADDHTAMMAKVCSLADDLEAAEEGHSTWHIDRWRKLEKRLHGPSFQCGNFEWKILLFPAGNQVDCVSLYLECSPIEKVPEGETPDWAVCAQFGLVLSNYRDPLIYTEHHASHRFTPDEKDWGFTKFYELRRLTTKHEDKDIPIVEDDKVNITAYVKIVKDPTGVLWHNFSNYDSKKETGYVGLKNQGATCYMNSLLQSLYFTKYFRKAVYQIPTEHDEPSSSVPLALQRVFYQLQTSKLPVGTLELTRSFGWDTTDAFTQHDVQELNRVLMDNLEGKMKGTKVQGALNELFVGQMKSFVKCINVDFESSRSEDFWDIQLNVKGMKDLHESFKDYIQVETLSGENQYQATGYGLQDAEKGVIFQSFPPVLHLQLKRFEYDFIKDMMVKINDRHEFPTEIDLQEFLAPDAPKDEPWVYVLHGVLVHSGDLNAGHYYALLKPDVDGDWYKFDDDRVTRATLKEVQDENYGEDPQQAPPNGNYPGQFPLRSYNKFSIKRHSNAYMLVYLRKSRAGTVLSPLKEGDTPRHLPERLEREAAEEEARRKEREEQHLYMYVKIMSNRQYTNYHGLDLGPFAEEQHEETLPEARPIVLKVLKTSTVKDLRDRVAKELEIDDPTTLRFWIMVTRENKTLRPEIPLLDTVPRSLEEIKDRHAGKAPDMRLWMEEAQIDPESNTIIPWQVDGGQNASKLLIFLKHFDPITQSLTGAGCCIVGRHDKVSDIFQHITKMMNWPASTVIELYEEIQPTMIVPIKANKTFFQVEIQEGDIICFQKHLPESELLQIHGCHDAKSYYDFLQNRTLIVFKPRLQTGEQEEFELWLSLKDTYQQLCQKVASHLKCDPTHLRFTTTQLSGSIKTVVKATSTLTLSQLIHTGYSQIHSNVILYEMLDLSLSELETKKALRLVWLTDGISQEHTYDILVPKNGTMADVLEVLKGKANLSDEAASRVRFYGVHMHKIHRLYAEDYTVVSIIDSTQLYAEELNEDDLNKTDEERYMEVYHFQKEPIRSHGVPFLFVIKPNEKFADTKVRLQKRTGIKDKLFEKVKFALVQRSQYSKPLYLEDEQIVYDIAEKDDLIGMDHLDKTTYKNMRHEQRAIFIKN